MVCSKCHQPCSNPSEVAKCSQCCAEFHPACCRVRTVAKLNAMIASGTPWRCENCSTDTTSTAHAPDQEQSAVMELLKTIQSQMAESSRENNSNFNALQQSMSTLQTSLEGVRAKLVAVEEENVKLKEECHRLVEASEKMSKRVYDLQWEVMELEQHSKLQNLEIRGIPVTAGENVYMVLGEVARALKLDFQPRDISIAHRLPAPRNKNFPPTIIAQFVNRSTRAEWLAAAKTNRIQTSDVLATFKPAPVYINEHLTRHNRGLLMRAKSFVRSGGLAFAWAKEGKVYVRKTKDSKAIRIFWSLGEIEHEMPPEGEKTAPNNG